MSAVGPELPAEFADDLRLQIEHGSMRSGANAYQAADLLDFVVQATVVVIDMTLAGLWWAMGGQDDVMAKLIKKVLYVGAFAFIIGNFNALAKIVFNSFAGLGLLAAVGCAPAERPTTAAAGKVIPRGRLLRNGLPLRPPTAQLPPERACVRKSIFQ